ncbi:MAG TPA: hypothetical protein VHT04_08035 [Stellaceae bacterium]|nr:hypothetical protein [Stellaceae bacterium]
MKKIAPTAALALEAIQHADGVAQLGLSHAGDVVECVGVLEPGEPRFDAHRRRLSETSRRI